MRGPALLTALALTVAMAVPAAAPARAAADPAPAAAGISSVAVSESSITVHGSIPSGDDPATTSVDVYELDPTQNASAYQQSTPVATAAAPLASSRSFDISFARFVGARDRYYSKFLAVVRDGDSVKPLGDAHYADDVRFRATNDFPYPQVADKKGLQVEMTDDAEQLGVRHAAVNVAFNQLMLLRDDHPSDTITFTVDGRTFYFDRNYVQSLDTQIKPLSDNGTLVNLILIMYRDTSANSAFPQLVHPDAALGSGTVYAFNTKTAEGLEYFKAAMQFLTQRYTRTDQRYGRALGYIVGNEVDSAYVWQNMGDQPLQAFLEYYSRALRVAWQAARAAYAGARVYVSLDHEWNVSYDPSRPQEYYPGRAVTDGLAALTRQVGDFPWDVAYHPYPQDLTNPAFWNDTQATADFDSPLITFKNIQELPAYLQQPALTYHGAQRRIILSEQGCNTPNDSLDAQKLQAACFAYAYYEIRFLDGIDAFILHRHVDHQAEGGLRLGLWTWDSNRADYAMPGAQKYSYDVFKYIDTARSLDVTRFALPIIGIRSWAQVIPGFDPAELAQRPLPTQVGTEIGARPVRARPVSGFDDGTDGWTPSDNADGVESVGGALRVHFDADLPAWSTDEKTWKAAQLSFTKPLDATPTPHLDLAVRIPSAPSNITLARTTVYGSDGSTAFGLARIEPDGSWTRLSLDLSSWPGRRAISRIKVAVRGSGDADWHGTYDIDQVAVSGATAAATGLRNIDLSAEVSSRKGVGATVTLSVTDNDTRPLTGELTVVPCDGVTTSPADLPLGRIAAAGGTGTLSTTITGYDTQDRAHPRICVVYRDQQLAAPIVLPPPTETVLYGFETGAQGWAPGQNVAPVSTVTGMANGPGTPHGGAYALDAAATSGDASALKTVEVSPSNPVDLSGAESLVAWVDAYGGAPGATGYAGEITAYSGNQSLSATLPSFQNDRWNRITLDLGSWPYRNNITKVVVGFRAVGTTAAWAPHFQVDDVGYLD